MTWPNWVCIHSSAEQRVVSDNHKFWLQLLIDPFREIVSNDMYIKILIYFINYTVVLSDIYIWSTSSTSELRAQTTFQHLNRLTFQMSFALVRITYNMNMNIDKEHSRINFHRNECFIKINKNLIKLLYFLVIYS